MTKRNPFRYFKTSPEIIRLAVIMYVRFPLSLRNVEDLLHERGIDVSHETVRYWWLKFGLMFASEIRKRRVKEVKSNRWNWYLGAVFVNINGERRYLWRAVDHEGNVSDGLEGFGKNLKEVMESGQTAQYVKVYHCSGNATSS